ncbi:MAG: hypothetical protein PXY39_14300 [archaeon]|nr:hypothetical protein [archaeon]
MIQPTKLLDSNIFEGGQLFLELKPKILFIAVAIIFLFLSLLVGIFRLMADNGLNTGILQNIYALHPILMVFGFLACIVMAERVAGISVIPDLQQSRVPLAMVPLVALGVLSELAGYSMGARWLDYVGGALLLSGCFAFIFVLFKLSGKTGIKLPFYFMILSAVSLSISAILSAFSLPGGNFPFIMLLLSFPLIFILGERVELTRFTSSAASTNRFMISFILAGSAVALFTLSSILYFLFDLQMMVLSIGSLLLLTTLIVVLLTENQNFNLLSRSREPLQRYVLTHTRVAYAWGILGLILAEIYFVNSRLDLYDAFIHSMAVGFIGTMLLAHGPVILPSVIGRKLDITRISLLPLEILTAGNLIRIVGDLILVNYNSAIVSVFVGLSGWLILIAVLAFLLKLIPIASSANQIISSRKNSIMSKGSN